MGKSVKGSRRQVWNGSKAKTNGSMTKSDLMMNKRGKVVSKKAHALGKRRYKKNGLSKWTKALQRNQKTLQQHVNLWRKQKEKIDGGFEAEADFPLFVLFLLFVYLT